MDSPSTSSASLPSFSGSHLLSESLPETPTAERTGPGGADLSLSELSLNDRPPEDKPWRFSLLAPAHQRGQDDASGPAVDDTINEEDEDGHASEHELGRSVLRASEAARAREERLLRDLHTLRKINASFAVFKEALRSTQTATETIGQQLSQTNALLDKYATVLAKSESATRLIFDQRWEGSAADEQRVLRERREEEERLRREAEERARQEAEREAVRREAEERARREAEERALAEERARSKIAPRGRGAGTTSSSRTPMIASGVRGVRGTRASIMAARGARGSTRGAPSGIPSSSAHTRTGSATGSVSGRSGSSISRGSLRGRV